MGWNSSTESNLAFVVDPKSINLNSGRQVDWANVADTFKNASGDKVLPAGTIIGEARGEGRVSPRAAATNPATGVMATPAVENSKSDSLSGYGVIIGGALYENMLPDAAGTPAVLPADVKTELQATGTGYSFEQYGDSRAV